MTNRNITKKIIIMLAISTMIISTTHGTDTIQSHEDRYLHDIEEVQDIQEQIETAQYTGDSEYHIAFSTMHSCDRVIARVSREYLFGLELIDTGHHVDVCVGVLWSNDSF